MTLHEAREHVGHKVIYSGPYLAEEGVITSVNDHYVFVRYGSDVHSKATSAAELTLLAAG